MPTNNKIRYGLSHLGYALATIATDNSASYGAVKMMPGARSISLTASGELEKWFADNVAYYIINNNQGYSGDLELAVIPEDFKTDCLKMVVDADGILYEDQGAEPAHFALVYQFEGDQKATRHCLYNVVAGRPEISGSTAEESIEPQTETIPIEAASIYVPALSKNLVKGSTNADSNSVAYNNWFTQIHVYTATTST